MGFTKKTWKNRIAEYINRRRITMEDGSASLVTVARDEGTISQEGDAFNAANMNNLEDRIASGFEEINQSLTEINKYQSSAEFVINEEFEMNYDAFLVYSVTYGSAPYTGYTLKINGVIRDATAAIDAVGNLSVTRTFEVKKGDKVQLDINSNTTCTSRIIYYK